MASLVEELVSIIEEEIVLYQQLAEYGEQKRVILIKADVPALEKLTALEQEVSDELLAKSNKQGAILKDISIVLGKSAEGMTVTKLIGYLGSQPDIQAKLTEAKENLIIIANEMERINQLNKALIAQAMEMCEFDITLFKSMRQAPETANYDRNAYNTGSILGGGGFDAKQ